MRRGTVSRATLVVVSVVGLVSLGNEVSAQQRELPSGWIDVSDSNVALAQLGATVRQAASNDGAWIGYSFPLRDGAYVGCDDWKGRSVSFGSGGARFFLGGDDEEPNLSCDNEFGLFLRFEGSDSAVVGARLSTLSRAADRFDDTVVWAGDYGATESVDYLRSAVLGAGSGGTRALATDSERVRKRLLSAIAMHDSRAAVDVVFEALEPSQSPALRESAVFWVGQVGADDGLRKLIALARSDSDTEVRKQSIFWLGQLAGERATEHLADIAEDDPDTEVRTSAVFALSQTEDDGAVDALVQIVRTNDNREVVKSALFWLGQSGDPRAVELFEELLFGG